MLTSENYYSPESNQGYMSASQFKSFLDCEARTLAELHGEYHRPSTEALLVGSYVDAYFERVRWMHLLQITQQSLQDKAN